MDPFSRLLGPAFGALMAVGQPGHHHPPRKPAPVVAAPIPRDRPSSTDAAAAGMPAEEKLAALEPAKPAETVPAAKQIEPPRIEPPKVEAKPEPAKVEPPKAEPPKVEAKIEPAKPEPPKIAAPKVDAPKTEPAEAAVPKVEASLLDGMPPAKAEGFIPIPQPRPLLAGKGAESAPPKTGRDDVKLASANPKSELPNVFTARPRQIPVANAYCLPQLASLQATFKPMATITEGECGIFAPVKLASIGEKEMRVKLTPAALIDCRVGMTLAHWLDEDVQPAAKTAFDGRVTGLRVAASYNCRPRDNIKGAPLSEHAFGNAIDISAFQIDNTKWIEVGPRTDAEAPDAKFLSEIRGEACGPFTTVLGPGSDSYHTNHFHLDLARRGKTGHSKFCQ